MRFIHYLCTALHIFRVKLWVRRTFSTQNKYDFTKKLQKTYILFISSTFWLMAATVCSSDLTREARFSCLELCSSRFFW